MKVLFLCAGYGTRLEQDLEESGEFKECIGRPKALLPIGEEALISFWFQALSKLEKSLEITIVTNDKFLEQFHKSKKWYSKTGQDFKIITDGSTSNENRLGAIADIKFAIPNADDDLLVIAGDTLFHSDFDLNDFIKEFERLKSLNKAPISLIVECPCPENELEKHGIIEVNESKIVTSFLEKPKPTETKSRSQSPCFYLFDQASQKLLEEYLSQDLSMKQKDATGNFLAFLVNKAKVFAFKTKGRFDVGNLASYKFCIENFTK